MTTQITSFSVIVEITHSGFSAYVKEVPGVVTVGQSWEEIKQNMREALALHFDVSQNPMEFGELSFFVDLKQFFDHFKVLNKSAFASYIGINQSQFRQYSNGLAPLSDKKLKEISDGLQRLSNELRDIQFV